MITKRIVALRARDLFRICAVAAVKLSGFEPSVSIHSGRPEARSRLSREEGIARPGGENHDPTFLQVTNGASAYVGLAHGAHRNGRVSAAGDPGTFSRPIR